MPALTPPVSFFREPEEGEFCTIVPSSGFVSGAPVTLADVCRTKIIVTLGPRSDHESMIKSLILAGVNIFRVNFSHGEGESHKQVVARIRQAAKSLDRPIGILADLQGPKFRTAMLKDDQPFVLDQNQSVIFTCDQVLSAPATEGQPPVIATKFKALIDALELNSVVLINDGKIRLIVTERQTPGTVQCRVVDGGLLEARKGINIPGSVIKVGALTEKDQEDAKLATEAGVDFLALSFVQRRQDIIELKDFLKSQQLTPPPIIAKIEKPQALLKIGEIMAEADAMMVARGDLGVELNPEEIPVVQKQLVRIANESEKPVIIATQMLESMIHSLQPARSDVSDIANAVFDGADALMLSGETAVGDHPIETVSMMRRIILEAERNLGSINPHPYVPTTTKSPNFYDAIAQAACYAVTKADVKALVVLSNSGQMARRLAKQKPQKAIIALTPSEAVYRQLALLWGVIPLMLVMGKDSDETIENGEAAILYHSLLKHGDGIVFCAGKTQMRGANNMLKIYTLGQHE